MTITVVMMVIVLIGATTLYGIYYISIGERIREIGKLKAVGATDGQLKTVLLGEGMITAAAAIPVGLVMGTILVKVVLALIMNIGLKDGVMDKAIRTAFSKGQVMLYRPVLYVIAVAAAVFSSSDPVDAANEGFIGEYEVAAVISHNDELRPEREWRLVQRNNPLNEELKRELMNIHRFIFPKEKMILMIGVLVLLQFVITVVLSGSLRKESVIDRVRFND